MKFTDFIWIDSITPEIKATDKKGVVCELVQSLVDAGAIKKDVYEEIVRAIIKREELGSTGIGRGIALPHTKYPSVKRDVGTLAISAEGIDFDSLDGEKMHLFFMVISPPDRPGDHLRIMEHITRRLKDDTFRLSLTQAKTREEILALFDEADSDETGVGREPATGSPPQTVLPSVRTYPNIFVAADHGTVDDVKYFIENEGVDVNAKGMYGCTPLHWAADRTGSLEIVQYLVSQCADVHATDNGNETPLSRAAAHSSLDVVQYLVSQGADVNAKDKSGTTPFHLAAKRNSLEVVQYLVSLGVDVHAKHGWGYMALHEAAWSNTLEVIQYLVSLGADVNVKADAGNTPLGNALASNTLEVVQYLISQGANVNVKGTWSGTLLHGVVSRYGRGDEYDIPALKILLSAGADVFAKNSIGKTPLEVASTEEKKRILREAMDKQKPEWSAAQ